MTAPRAQADALDPTFGSGGIVTTPIGGTGALDFAFALARQPDGKLVLAGRTGGDGDIGPQGSGGNFALARYNADGSLDSSFDGDGKVTTDIAPGARDQASGVAIQADGKIVVGGFADTPTADVGDFAVVRYNPDGSLDPSFGGDGTVTTDMSPSALAHDAAWAVAIQPDGKIVLAGESDDDFALARYNADGTLDTGFDGDGKLTTAIGSPGGLSPNAEALAVQPDGKIVAAGTADMARQGDFADLQFALARYNADGSLDGTFDGDGVVTTKVSPDPRPFDSSEAHAVAIQPDGKIVAAGEACADICSVFGLARYNADGSLDTGFGGDGKVTTAVGSLTSFAQALAIRADGKLVAAGDVGDCSTGQCHTNFALARYMPDGSLDPTFDGDGEVTTAVAPDEQIDIGRALAIQPDGKPVVAGYADMGPPEFIDPDLALVRYLPDGDPTPGLEFALSGRKKQRLGKAVKVKASCDEDCTARATGKLVVPPPNRFSFAKRFKLTPETEEIAAGGSAALKLGIKKKARKAAAKALKQGRKVKAKVKVRATDAADNASVEKRTIALKR